MEQIFEDLKKDYLVSSEYIRSYLDHYSSQVGENYSDFRSGFMKFLRENIIDYDFFIHAALVQFQGKLRLIIGDKGCGKTSSTLYFYENGGEVYTDELVYFKNNKIYCIGRNLSLDSFSLENYFTKFKPLVWKENQSKLNDEPKFLIDIGLAINNNGFNFLDEIIILVPQNNKNVHLTKREKYGIIERQFFINESVNHIDMSSIFNAKINVLMISELNEKINYEKNQCRKSNANYWKAGY